MKNNYIIIGDSITYGIWDLESGGWSAMFKNLMEITKQVSIIINQILKLLLIKL